eukprot:CAMPEP_0115507084 /NCGR_PEP_ID=MMETSP0271-20121206/71530_1 /TAXON_ID=71861 /ORGANISM="Scrippsiella trochoidea, Strain CCMP3099" /LENGTH=197 /DNA_ID=CAMNT_0002936637 /DNA_START=198 /DNA_END=792 /DNA_ORIENTATION=-
MEPMKEFMVSDGSLDAEEPEKEEVILIRIQYWQIHVRQLVSYWSLDNCDICPRPLPNLQPRPKPQPKVLPKPSQRQYKYQTQRTRFWTARCAHLPPSCPRGFERVLSAPCGHDLSGHRALCQDVLPRKPDFWDHSLRQMKSCPRGFEKVGWEDAAADDARRSVERQESAFGPRVALSVLPSVRLASKGFRMRLVAMI